MFLLPGSDTTHQQACACPGRRPPKEEASQGLGVPERKRGGARSTQMTEGGGYLDSVPGVRGPSPLLKKLEGSLLLAPLTLRHIRGLFLRSNNKVCPVHEASSPPHGPLPCSLPLSPLLCALCP